MLSSLQRRANPRKHRKNSLSESCVRFRRFTTMVISSKTRREHKTACASGVELCLLNSSVPVELEKSEIWLR